MVNTAGGIWAAAAAVVAVDPFDESPHAQKNQHNQDPGEPRSELDVIHTGLVSTLTHPLRLADPRSGVHHTDRQLCATSARPRGSPRSRIGWPSSAAIGRRSLCPATSHRGQRRPQPAAPRACRWPVRPLGSGRHTWSRLRVATPPILRSLRSACASWADEPRGLRCRQH